MNVPFTLSVARRLRPCFSTTHSSAVVEGVSVAVGGAADGVTFAVPVAAGGSEVAVSCGDGKTVGVRLGSGTVVAGAFDSVDSGVGCDGDPQALNKNAVIVTPTQKRLILHLCYERHRLN